MDQKGFSLIELLIAIAIFGILLTALTAFFISQNRQYVVQSEIVAMQDNARATMDFVVRMLRNSKDQVVDPPGPDDPEYDEDYYISKECNHILEITDIWDVEHEYKRKEEYTEADGSNSFRFNNQAFALNIICFEVVENGSQFEIKITAETERILPGTGDFGTITLQSTVTPRNID